jgi:hypothetical protein
MEKACGEKIRLACSPNNLIPSLFPKGYLSPISGGVKFSKFMLMYILLVKMDAVPKLDE